MPDSVPFAAGFVAGFVAEFGDRCVCGSNRPHLNLSALPDDGPEVDPIKQIAPGTTALKVLPMDNSARFYRIASC